jgi:murein DD-endopeptidase MepM/ murein hydrolase activator NlpD
VAVLAVWSSANLPHLLTAGHATAVIRTADPAALGGGTLASGPAAVTADAVTGGTVARLATSDRRVSRQTRAVSLAGPAARVGVRPTAGRAAHWVRPSSGAQSSCFCMRWGAMHEGIDLAGPLGSPIVAVGDGVVVDAGPAAGFGLWVAIRHADGDYSIYGHMYRYYVRVGEHVRAGQHIADIGANGQSTGPHLHFAVARGKATGPFLDPVPWLRARGVEVGPYEPDA